MHKDASPSYLLSNCSRRWISVACPQITVRFVILFFFLTDNIRYVSIAHLSTYVKRMWSNYEYLVSEEISAPYNRSFPIDSFNKADLSCKLLFIHFLSNLQSEICFQQYTGLVCFGTVSNWRKKREKRFKYLDEFWHYNWQTL